MARHRTATAAFRAKCSAAILTEVALIRDVYQERKGERLGELMDGLVRLVMAQEDVTDCPLWSELPEVLRDPRRTHPRQIRQKAESEGVDNLGAGFRKVYGALQGIFNAKPDLALVLPDHLLVVEAKLTQDFDHEQLRRTENIAALWASPLLRGELGYLHEPSWSVIRLGAAAHSPDLSWEQLASIAAETWPEGDRSLIAFRSAVSFLARGTSKSQRAMNRIHRTEP